MAVKDTTVKFLHSGMTGAPTLAGTAGYAITVFDAALVNGFNSQTATTLAVSSNVATLTKTSHGFEVGSVINVSGATPSGFNGDWRIDTVPTADTFTFETSGISDQTATGTITVKYAPLNWEKSHSGTNLAAYKGLGSGSTGFKLKVDDTGTTSCRVVGYETMASISDTSGPAFPTAAQVSGGYYWQKSNAADTTARTWIIIGNGRTFYFHVLYYITSGYSTTVMFGDFTTKKSGEVYNCCLLGATSAYTTSSPTVGSDISYSNTTTGTFALARSYTSLGTATNTVYKIAPIPVTTNAGQWSGATGGMLFPNYTDGGLYVIPMNIAEAGIIWRGLFTGVYFVPHNVSTNFYSRDKVTNFSNLSGKTLYYVQSSNSTGANSGSFFDITGPWSY